MGRRINKILNEMIDRKSKVTLNENMKIFKSEPVISKASGPGYWLYISSNSPEGNTYKDETLEFGSKYQLPTSNTNKDVRPFRAKWGFLPPEHTIQYDKHGSRSYVNKETGQFGYGYFIPTNATATYVDAKLNDLKSLVRDYNMQKELESDVETGNLTSKQVGQIQNLTSAIESVIETEMNPETKAKLEQYLDELANSIEQDEVFDFLAKKYEEASKLVKGENDGAVGHKYKITNSMIIMAVDPNAIIAGQKDFWEGRGYQIKPGKESGISIWRPGKNTTAQTSNRCPVATALYRA